MAYLNEFLTLALIGFLGCASPGPDFVIVTQTSLQHGKKAGISASLGIALGCLVHISYCIVGIALIVSESILAFNIIKYLGAAYLIYLGYKGLTTKANTVDTPIFQKENKLISTRAALKKGLWVNLLNPKATLFFLSVFTQVIDPDTPRTIKALYGLEFSVIAFAWFSLLACILSNPTLKRKLLSIQHYIEKTLGAFLILFGLKVATLNQS